MDVIREIAEHYGLEHQAHQLVEEMAELTQALNKLWRKVTASANPVETDLQEIKLHVAEEIADVEICLKQVQYLLGVSNDVHDFVTGKINRQLDRIAAENERNNPL